MRNIITLTKKEFLSYFNSPLAYIFASIFLTLTGWLFFSSFFLINQATMRSYFNLLPLVFLILIPALTMRLWAEERRSGTIEHLLTLPITDTEAVLAKFFSSLAFLATVLVGTLSIPITVSRLGNLDTGPVLGSYIGTLLLAAVYIALGLFISSQTPSQVAAYLLSATISFLLFILGSDFVLTQIGGPVSTVFAFIGLAGHFENIARGVLDSRNLIYFILLTMFFLFLNIKAVERRDAGSKSKYSVNIFAQILIFFLILIITTYISSLYPLRLDLTENKIYSLSKPTKDLLNSLDDIVTIKAFFSKDLPPSFLTVRQEVLDTLKDYEALSKGNINLEVLDPKEKEKSEAEVRSLGIPILQFSDIEKDTFQIKSGYLGLAVFYEDRSEVLPIIENTKNLEYDLTSAIKKTISSKTPTVAFTNGHDEYKGETDLNLIWKLLQKRYTVREVDLSRLDEIPADIDTLVIAGPKKAFLKEELFVLDQILMEGKSLFLLLDGVQVSTNLQSTPSETGLDELLNHYGVKLNSDLVADLSSEMESFYTGFTTIITPYPFLVKVRKEGFDKNNLIVNRLESLTLPWVSSVEILKENLAGKEIVDLIKTSEKSWVQTGPFNLDPNQNVNVEKGDLGEKTVGILLGGHFRSFFKKQEIPEKFAGLRFIENTENARLILVGDSDFILDNRVSRFQDNAIFFTNAVDFLSQDPDLISIRTKATRERPLKLGIDENQRALFRYSNIFGPPSVLIILGVVRASYRKRRPVNIDF